MASSQPGNEMVADRLACRLYRMAELGMTGHLLCAFAPYGLETENMLSEFVEELLLPKFGVKAQAG